MSNNSTQQPTPLPAPVPTGSLLVVMKPNMKSSVARQRLKKASGYPVASASDLFNRDAPTNPNLENQGCLYFDRLGVAVMHPKDNANMSALSASLSADDSVASVRPEFYMFATETADQRYQEWVRQGLKILADGAPIMRSATNGTTRNDQRSTGLDATWGISAINAEQSPYTGRNIKIAVLDTGFVLDHPDYVGRSISSQSFVPNEDVMDQQGHGTHCIGTAAGPIATNQHPRYGVAPDAEICVGKVLNNQGSGKESWILAGIEWAISNRCEVISMSLGRNVQPGEQPDPLYELAGQTALSAGSLIIAAAGNNSARQFNFVAPVNAPANSPSIMAVASVGSDLGISHFSCGEINGNGGEVNISAPGEDVLSSFLLPLRHQRLSGTSMATPHVAGVAALLAQSDPNLRGQALWDALQNTAKNIGLTSGDGGAGFLQAPGTTTGSVLIS